MKRNLPVTQHEVFLKPGAPIVTKTDLKGRITYCNPSFVDISGFAREELLGTSHNIVRHPDMPPEAFDDLWKTIKAGHPWHGLVKNRCKNGDFYWVDAYVTPVTENGSITGYMSVRAAPQRSDVAAAERLYADVLSGRGPFPRTVQRSCSFSAALLGVAAWMGCVATLLWLSGALHWPRWVDHMALVVGVTAGSAAFLWLRRLARRPLAEAHRACRELAEGNFNFRTEVDGCSEFKSVLADLESMRISLRAIFADVTIAAHTVDAKAACLTQQADGVLSRSSEQSEGIAGVAAALEELAVSVQEISDSTVSSSRRACGASPKPPSSSLRPRAISPRPWNSRLRPLPKWRKAWSA